MNIVGDTPIPAAVLLFDYLRFRTGEPDGAVYIGSMIITQSPSAETGGSYVRIAFIYRPEKVPEPLDGSYHQTNIESLPIGDGFIVSARGEGRNPTITDESDAYANVAITAPVSAPAVTIVPARSGVSLVQSTHEKRLTQ